MNSVHGREDREKGTHEMWRRHPPGAGGAWRVEERA